MKRYNKPIVVTMFILLLILAFTVFAEANDKNGGTCKFSENQRLEMAYKWLIRQQDSKTNLLYSYDIPSDKTAWTYDQAIGIISFMVVGDISAAEDCADAMVKIRDKKYSLWADSYDVRTGEVLSKPIAIGPNAWMGLALVQLYATTGKNEYLTAAEKIGDFILKLQLREGSTKGSIPGGYDAYGGSFPWTSTEHNVDTIALLAALAEATGNKYYHESAIQIVKWLNREMWASKSCYYRPGYSDNTKAQVSSFPELVDSQTWTILALLGAAERSYWSIEVKELFHNGLTYIDYYTSNVPYKGKFLVGLPKKTLRDKENSSFWSEGTAGYLLAASRTHHENLNLDKISSSLRDVQRADGSVPYSLGISCPDVPRHFQAADLIVADFESHPNRLWGQIGIYGDGEPDWEVIKKVKQKAPYSWYYDKNVPDYDKNNVHSGFQSFRLVNAGAMCKSKTKEWASIGLDLIPMDKGFQTKFVDVKSYKKLSFWAKTENRESANLKVLFQDVYANSYLPQISVIPEPSTLKKNWRRFSVDLKKTDREITLSKLVHIGFAFGKDVKNSPDTVIYIDDVAFIGSGTVTNLSNGDHMPPVYPMHWPFGNVAATAWLLFTELNINPFGPIKVPEERMFVDRTCPEA